MLEQEQEQQPQNPVQNPQNPTPNPVQDPPQDPPISSGAVTAGPSESTSESEPELDPNTMEGFVGKLAKMSVPQLMKALESMCHRQAELEFERQNIDVVKTTVLREISLRERTLLQEGKSLQSIAHEAGCLWPLF